MKKLHKRNKALHLVRLFIKNNTHEIEFLIVALLIYIAAFTGIHYTVNYLADELSRSLPWHLFWVQATFTFMVVHLVGSLEEKDFTAVIINIGLTGVGLILWISSLRNMELAIFM